MTEVERPFPLVSIGELHLALSKQVQELTDIVVRHTEESSKRADYNEMYLKVLALLTPRCSGAHELSMAMLEARHTVDDIYRRKL